MAKFPWYNKKHQQNPTTAATWFNDKPCNYSFSNITRIFKSSRLIIFILTDDQTQTEPFVPTSLNGLSLMSKAEMEDRRASAELKR